MKIESLYLFHHSIFVAGTPEYTSTSTSATGE
jgi:hypothetical protein